MAEALAALIRQEIAARGAMSAARYMSLALGHPEHGYYMTRDPFGRGGDFITAPEVSQMFGEMIGAWAADVWAQMGRPSPFAFVECGPGRGTLMADMLRACGGVKGFTEAAQVHLIEMSPVLRAAQERFLGVYDPVWCVSAQDVPGDMPMIIVANEFLDALPFMSLQRVQGGWAERCIDVDVAGRFVWSVGAADEALLALVPFHLQGAAAGSIFEAAPAREDFARQVAGRLVRQGGAALFIDYGHTQSACGDTFQAVRGHQFVDPFDDVGQADLTSHVDFEALAGAVQDDAVVVHGAVTQGDFLRGLGIEMRAQVLMQSNSGQHADEVGKALHRLVGSGEMGGLFKVLEMRSRGV